MNENRGGEQHPAGQDQLQSRRAQQRPGPGRIAEPWEQYPPVAGADGARGQEEADLEQQDAPVAGRSEIREGADVEHCGDDSGQAITPTATIASGEKRPARTGVRPCPAGWRASPETTTTRAASAPIHTPAPIPWATCATHGSRDSKLMACPVSGSVIQAPATAEAPIHQPARGRRFHTGTAIAASTAKPAWGCQRPPHRLSMPTTRTSSSVTGSSSPKTDQVCA